MTGNIGFGKENIYKAVSKHFSPELINRIDDVIIFNYLNKDDIEVIYNRNVNRIISKTKENYDLDVQISSDLRDYIIMNCNYSEYGARDLHRLIVQYIEDPISENLLKSHEDDCIILSKY
jgi:ATP-dependent Clp protease ATP-binding subunit ClpC